MLEQVLKKEVKRAHCKPEPVAWKELDYGPTHYEGTDDFYTARVQWNIEQAQRRVLRNLEARGWWTLAHSVFY
jgi:hypothetical protein